MIYNHNLTVIKKLEKSLKLTNWKKVRGRVLYVNTCMQELPSLLTLTLWYLRQSSFYLHLHYDIFVNPASTYTYYRLLILLHQSKFTETRVIFCNKQIRLRDFRTKLRQLDVIVWDPGKCSPVKGNAALWLAKFQWETGVYIGEGWNERHEKHINYVKSYLIVEKTLSDK